MNKLLGRIDKLIPKKASSLACVGMVVFAVKWVIFGSVIAGVASVLLMCAALVCMAIEQK
jgi:hypothetical protein